MGHLNEMRNGHDLTVSGYLIRTDGAEPRLMLHWHKFLEAWLQFGGHNERDENLWEAMRRELDEEAGYDLAKLELLQPRQRIRSLPGALLHPLPFVVNTHELPGAEELHFHEDLAFTLLTDRPPARSVAEGESEQMLLVTRSELADLPAGKIIENVRQIGLYALDLYAHPDFERVPASSFAFTL